MQIFKYGKPFFRRLFFVIFNAGAVRKAYKLQLFSLEFCLGFALWIILAGVVLLRLNAQVALPTWLILPIALVSVFIGCCWIVLPLVIYLERKGNQFLTHPFSPGNLINTLNGATLWHRAIQGKLSAQFLGAILLDIGCLWLLFPWHIAASWQALFHLAFFANTIFYIVFPLLLFLGEWMRRGVQKELFQRSHQTRSGW